jgi:hypothetical protein
VFDLFAVPRSPRETSEGYSVRRHSTTPRSHVATHRRAVRRSDPSLPVSEHAASGTPISDEIIRARAYEKWEGAGRPAGDGVSFWLEAVYELSRAK